MRRRTRQGRIDAASGGCRAWSSLPQISPGVNSKNRRWLQPLATSADQSHTAFDAQRARRRSGLEIQFRTKLVSPRIRRHAAGLAEIGVRLSIAEHRIPGVVAAEICVVEGVKEIQSEPDRDRTSAEAREVFAQPHVDGLVRERTRRRESSPYEGAAKALAAHIKVLFAAKRDEAGILYSPQVG